MNGAEVNVPAVTVKVAELVPLLYADHGETKYLQTSIEPIGVFVKVASANPSPTGGTVRTASVEGVVAVAASNVDGVMETSDTETYGALPLATPPATSAPFSVTQTVEPAGIGSGTTEHCCPGAARATTATVAQSRNSSRMSGSWSGA